MCFQDDDDAKEVVTDLISLCFSSHININAKNRGFYLNDVKIKLLNINRRLKIIYLLS